MARWQPGARDRLRETALQLFAERGYEATTTADIAAAVGLTERTFFRHFADKREVLFAGQDLFQAGFVDGIAEAPEGGSALEVVASALESAAAFFPDERRDHSRLRQTIIVANAPLLEREALKMAWLADALAAGLRERGVDEPEATLAAQSAVSVFGVSFRQWIADGETRSLVDIERDVWAGLRDLVR